LTPISGWPVGAITDLAPFHQGFVLLGRVNPVVFLARTIVPAKPVDVIGKAMLGVFGILGYGLVGCNSFISDLLEWEPQSLEIEQVSMI
jgi:hypothetical protein